MALLFYRLNKMKVSGPESLAFILLLTVYLPQNSHSSNATRFRDLVKVLAFIISKPKGKKNHPCFLQIFDYAFASSIHILMFWQKKKQPVHEVIINVHILKEKKISIWWLCRGEEHSGREKVHFQRNENKNVLQVQRPQWSWHGLGSTFQSLCFLPVLASSQNF